MGSQIFSIMQIFLAVLLVIFILLQAKGSGLGATFGSDLGFYRTRRGFEKLLFYLTIGVALLFLVASLVGLML